MVNTIENKAINPIPQDRVSVIEINGYLFGVDILKSKEVFPLPAITPVPNVQEHIAGIFNLRGEIYPLVDISPILGLELKPILSSDMVFLLGEGHAGVGILTDRVHGVQTINSRSIKSPKGSIPPQMQEYVEGMVSDRSTEIYLLNIDRVIAALTSETFK